MRPRPSSRGERLSPLPCSRSAVSLQCGHGLQAVENTCACPACRAKVVASMRPRPSSRGEPLSPRYSQRPRTRFNAATAFKPWRTSVTLGALARFKGFNAATAFKPWRTSAARTQRGQQPCFNAATAFKPWRTAAATTDDLTTLLLQCGHGLQAVENHADHRVHPPLRHGFNAATAFKPWRTRLGRLAPLNPLPASMRPRPSSRGEQELSFAHPCGARDASMRPRPSSRGERRRRAASSSPTRWLQCGHGLQAVENFSRRSRKRRCRAASMRPRPSSRGEQRLGPFGRHIPNGFNAATSFKPWRTSLIRATRSASSCFNAATAFKPWRTGPTANGLWCRYSFNAATAFKPWRTLAKLLALYGKEPCFNAATAFKPWRTSPDEFLSRWAGRGLQCGHGLQAVENAAQRGLAVGQRVASMRPRPSSRGERPRAILDPELSA